MFKSKKSKTEDGAAAEPAAAAAAAPRVIDVRREQFALSIMSGLAASPNHSAVQQADYDRLAKEAVIAADALIAVLDKKGA